MSAPFGDRLELAFARHGRLCVGIDPHTWLLEEWGIADDADGAREFGLRVVDAAADRVGIVKPQVAFFERFGPAGFEALEAVIGAARAAGLLVIADAKRGDVGSTVDAYARAWLSTGAPLESDAMTVSAFQGVGSIAAATTLAAANGKGLFVLAATSNPEGVWSQQAIIRTGPHAGQTVSRSIVDDVDAVNRELWSGSAFGSAGVVIGATLTLEEFGLDRAVATGSDGPILPVLAPGFGHQGADAENAQQIYGALARGVIVSESRSVLSAGPTGLAAALSRRAEKVKISFA
ncbi:orotidine-5'-phosphate decarboxylase [Okibacterium endophyticum]